MKPGILGERVGEAVAIGTALISRLTIQGLRARLSPELNEMLRRVLQVAEEDRFRLFLVGGPVRDWFLGEKIEDLDLCVESNDLNLAGELAANSSPQNGRVVIHDRFGTARIEVGGCSLDIANTRSETYASAGCLPKVCPADLVGDLGRRDFTINSMAFALSSEAKACGAALIDPYGGVRDLKRRQLRILHANSFCDDPTRAFRAARFAARFSFSLDRQSRNALKVALASNSFSNVKGERFRREVEKIGEDGRGGSNLKKAVTLLHQWGVVDDISSTLALTGENQAALGRLGKAFQSGPWTLRALTPWKVLLRVWLTGCDPKSCRETLENFAIHGKVADEVIQFQENSHGILKKVEQAGSRGLLDQMLSGFSEEDLLSLFCIGNAAVRRRFVQFCAVDRNLRLPVTAGDLSKLGFSGAGLGQALQDLRVLFINGEIQGPVNTKTVARILGTPTGFETL